MYSSEFIRERQGWSAKAGGTVCTCDKDRSLCGKGMEWGGGLVPGPVPSPQSPVGGPHSTTYWNFVRGKWTCLRGLSATVSAVYARRISESDATDNNTCRFGLFVVFWVVCSLWLKIYDVIVRRFEISKEYKLKLEFSFRVCRRYFNRLIELSHKYLDWFQFEKVNKNIFIFYIGKIANRKSREEI